MFGVGDHADLHLHLALQPLNRPLSIKLSDGFDGRPWVYSTSTRCFGRTSRLADRGHVEHKSHTICVTRAISLDWDFLGSGNEETGVSCSNRMLAARLLLIEIQGGLR